MPVLLHHSIPEIVFDFPLKLGKYFKDNNRSVVFGAADTFRAAAIDQLKIWAEKVNVPVVSQQMGSDPASVAYDTLQSAKSSNKDVVIIIKKIIYI